MQKINVQSLKENFPKYIKRLRAGHGFILCYHNQPLAEVLPLTSEKSRERRFGGFAGRFKFDYSQFETSPELLNEFYKPL